MDSAAEVECRLLQDLHQTPAIFEAIQQVQGLPELARQKKLRTSWPEDLLRAALTLFELRQKAKSKFSLAERMWFDRVGLEQSTPEIVARHKAKRFSTVLNSSQEIWDLCSGIGGDALALAETGPVVSFDTNPAQNLRVKWNAEVFGLASRLETRCQDVLTLTDWDRLVHCDPDRRANAAPRARRLEDYLPGLEWLQELTTRARGGAIKLGPASNFGGKFPHAEIEIISLHGECKEATVWFGELATSEPYRATILPANVSLAGHPLAALAPRSSLQNYLYDPDPAIVRAGLVDQLAVELGLSRLDEAEEYLTSEHAVFSPFVQTFVVCAELPNQSRALRDWFRQSDFGQLEIKCRHIPIQADKLRKELPLPGQQPGVLVVARIAGKARAITAQRFEETRQ